MKLGWALVLCYNYALFHTQPITHSDTVAALCNCLLLLLDTLLFPWRQVGFSILLKDTSTENVKGAESLSHSISPHRFSQLVWDWKRRPWHNKLTAEPLGHCPTVPQSLDCHYKVHRKDTWCVCIDVCMWTLLRLVSVLVFHIKGKSCVSSLIQGVEWHAWSSHVEMIYSHPVLKAIPNWAYLSSFFYVTLKLDRT